MGRAIDMEKNLEKHEIRIKKLEGVVSELIDIVEKMRKVNSVKTFVNEEGKNVKKKKANNKRTKSVSSGK